jgi:molybdopterin converting factor small subunit
MLASGAKVPGEALEMLGEKIKAATGSYALMTQLMSATTQYELQRAATAIGEAFDYQAKALGHVTEAAERYGITLEELGPAMQRQQLDEQAAQLYKDWQVLNQAGLDTVVADGDSVTILPAVAGGA